VISPGTKVNSWSSVRDSVIFDNVDVGRNAVVHRAIIDKNVRIADGAQVGVDLEHDLDRGFTVTESGITVVPKCATVRRYPSGSVPVPLRSHPGPPFSIVAAHTRSEDRRSGSVTS